MLAAPDDRSEKLNAALEGRYHIQRVLGVGGMATVYLATDIRHRRNVALKVLRAELSFMLGAERFVKEIETTAKLHHPYILPLHDSGEVDGSVFYVMPFVEGETLRDRLNRERQLPIDEAVRLTLEVASALDYAHRKGIVHRDIKPENILLHEGQAFVADFGIALAAATTGGARLTESGMSLGTPHYMSPEQAAAERTVDARADVYALGCVLYEMLIGEPPFTGPTAQAVAARVMTGVVEEPRKRRQTVPDHVNAVVLTALEKVPADRFESAAAMAAALKDLGYGGLATAGRRDGETSVAVRSIAPVRRHLGTLAVAGLVLAAVGLAARSLIPFDDNKRIPLRVLAALPYGLELPSDWNGHLALSPDGSTMVLAATDAREGPDGVRQLWVRAMDGLTATPIPSTRHAAYPRFSPDGRSVAYFDLSAASGRVKIVDLEGGSPRLITDSASRSELGFTPDGAVVVAKRGHLIRIAPDGTERVLSTPDRQSGEAGHAGPEVLPGGRALVFRVQYPPTSDFSRFRIAALDLESGRHHVLTEGVAARYVRGHLLVVHANGELTAAPFDAKSLAFTGKEMRLLNDVRVNDFGRIDLTIDDKGMLAYVPGGSHAADANLIWLTRDGTVSLADSTWRANFTASALSPSGREIAVSIGDATTEDVWVRQADGAKVRVSNGPSRNYRPRFTPDGRSVMYISENVVPAGLAVRRLNGLGDRPSAEVFGEIVLEALDSPPNGQWQLVRLSVAQGDIMARRAGDTVLTPLIATAADERHPSLSPDGRWIAYRSNESGTAEVFVRPFPNVSDGKWLVSLDGGSSPVWSRSGTELFYIRGGRELWAATVVTQPTFIVRGRKKLFDLPDGARPSPSSVMFDVAPGDQRFLMIRTIIEGHQPDPKTNMVLVTDILQAATQRATVR